MDLKTHRIILSRHVIFDETTFPAAQKASQNSSPYHFLNNMEDTSLLFKTILELNQAPPLPPIQHQESNPPIQALAPTRMTTRCQPGIVKPKKIFSLVTSSVSRIPSNQQKALGDPNWKPAITKEYNAQINNRTWRLVPRPFSANIINSMWLFKEKHNAYGIPTTNKARLVANGKTQQAGVDYEETFSPVVKPAYI